MIQFFLNVLAATAGWKMFTYGLDAMDTLKREKMFYAAMFGVTAVGCRYLANLIDNNPTLLNL